MQMTYDESRDAWIQQRPKPEVNRRVYGTYDGRLRIEETRDYDIQSGGIHEHSAVIASLSAAGPFLTDSDVTEGMQAYHNLEGVSGL